MLLHRLLQRLFCQGVISVSSVSQPLSNIMKMRSGCEWLGARMSFISRQQDMLVIHSSDIGTRDHISRKSRIISLDEVLLASKLRGGDPHGPRLSSVI
ncbi:hypothetical protein GALMADRAFT_221184 [Galerina marginata CBS 339.88]|uniref:Uncharacterized protein n=1 Tax=Galerina marginata (strain CBS 339.88) TaxID=685588 RepID=A0A067TW84_GALM3|nr:hypothetical protein GALMADRAFT_221184 [Galerina marginata CBS 339.88]